MKVNFEPSGTQVRKGKLLIRLDFYPEATDESFSQHYVDVVDKDGNPTGQKQINPCLCYFVPAPTAFTKADFANYIDGALKPDVVATIDHVMTLPSSAHYISPYMRNLIKWSDKTVNPADAADLIASVNDKLRNVSVSLVSGNVQNIIPKSIAIGPGATDRAAFANAATYVDKNVTATGTGTIDTWQLYAVSNLSNCEVATFYVVSGDNLSTRDVETIGAVTAGSIQTFSSLSTDVTLGDYPGLYFSAGTEEYQTSGAGVWYNGLDKIPCTNTAFTNVASRTISIYGTGTTGDSTVSVPTATLNLGTLTSVLQHGYNIPIVNLKTTGQVGYLARSIFPVSIDLKTTGQVGYLAEAIYPIVLNLKTNTFAPGLGTTGVNTIITPGEAILILHFSSPAFFGGNFTVTITGRYGTPPTETWVNGLTKSGRYGA